MRAAIRPRTDKDVLPGDATLPDGCSDLIFVLVERSYLHSAPCTVVKVVLAIRIALGVVWPLRMSVMGRRVLRDLDLLHVVVSKRQGERVKQRDARGGLD